MPLNKSKNYQDLRPNGKTRTEDFRPGKKNGVGTDGAVVREVKTKKAKKKDS